MSSTREPRMSTSQLRRTAMVVSCMSDVRTYIAPRKNRVAIRMLWLGLGRKNGLVTETACAPSNTTEGRPRRRRATARSRRDRTRRKRLRAVSTTRLVPREFFTELPFSQLPFLAISRRASRRRERQTPPTTTRATVRISNRLHAFEASSCHVFRASRARIFCTNTFIHFLLSDGTDCYTGSALQAVHIRSCTSACRPV